MDRASWLVSEECDPFMWVTLIHESEICARAAGPHGASRCSFSVDIRARLPSFLVLTEIISLAKLRDVGPATISTRNSLSISLARARLHGLPPISVARCHLRSMPV